MMKKIALIIILSLTTVAGALLCGCVRDSMKFTDFKQYKSFDKNVEYIEVGWDVGEFELVNFTINEQSTVQEIINYYSQAEFKKKEAVDGSRSEIRFVYNSGDKLIVGLSQLIENKQYYGYVDNSIYYRIKEIGVKKGVINL